MSNYNPPQSKVLKTYDYFDFSPIGEARLAYQVVRTDPKGFWQRRPAPDGDGWINQMGAGWVIKENGKWRFTCAEIEGSVRVFEVRKVPYRLRDLRDKPNQPILVVEGEKSADELASLGYVATCSPGGAGHWPIGFGGYLSNRDVVIFPDNDDPGMQHAASVAGSALLSRCKSIRVMRPNHAFDSGIIFNIGAGEDVWDWLQRQGDPSMGEVRLRAHRYQAIKDLVRQYPKFTWADGDKVPRPTAMVKETKVRGERKQSAYKRDREAGTTPVRG